MTTIITSSADTTVLRMRGVEPIIDVLFPEISLNNNEFF
jgi:hypothetical protein